MGEYKQDNRKPLPACKVCMILGSRQGVFRCLVRFMLKYWAAQSLNCKLFHGEAAHVELMAGVRGTTLYKEHKDKFDETFQRSTPRLQQFCRKSWLYDGKMTKQMSDFVEVVVQPCLKVNVDSIPDSLAEISAKFAAILAGGTASEQDLVDVKLAAACISGRLSGHPLIQGLTLQLHRKLEKLDRGIETMTGRRSKESLLEKQLVCDAGLSLAVAAGNSRLAREFGLARDSHRISFDVLTENGLPVPALASVFPQVLQQNFTLVDQSFIRQRGAPKRFLAFTESLSLLRCQYSSNHVFVFGF